METFMARIPRWWDWLPLAAVFAFVVYTAYDLFCPVVLSEAKIVLQTPDNVVIALRGTKVRECRYLGVQAYSVHGEGIRHAAQIKRTDTASAGRTLPRGKYHMGEWDIRPTTGAKGVIVFAQHACDADDLRATKLAEVALL